MRPSAVKECATCRFWSSLLAQAEGGGPVEAVCLRRASPNFQRFISGNGYCEQWKENAFGAIDEPGAVEAYEEEEGG